MNSLKENLIQIMQEFYPIGANEESNGVTRLGYSEVEDKMHEKFLELAKAYGLGTYVDEVGNAYAYLGEYDEYHLIGSHLDSVIEGGRFDGVVGVATGLAILKYLKDENINLPIKTVAFRCEESSNFMHAMLGSNLVTGHVKFENIKELKNREGKTLGEIFTEKGYSFEPGIISGVKDYIEIHIEQGRVLEEHGNEIGIVNTIAGGIKIVAELEGMAEHAGATPMNLRADTLAATAEIILKVEKIAKNETETSVGTVGFIENRPNSMNVVPGHTKFSVDLRDIHNDSMDNMMKKTFDTIERVCVARGIKFSINKPSISPAVSLSDRMIKHFEQIALWGEYKYEIMPSGASHDCMKMVDICDSILLFVPCEGGVSHNPIEFASIDDMTAGAKIILEYLIEVNK